MKLDVKDRIVRLVEQDSIQGIVLFTELNVPMDEIVELEQKSEMITGGTEESAFLIVKFRDIKKYVGKMNLGWMEIKIDDDEKQVLLDVNGEKIFWLNFFFE